MLQKLFQDIIFRKDINVNQIWKYPIINKLDNNYNYNTAQQLFEFMHNVSIANCNNIPLCPPNISWDVVIPINTTIYYEEINVLWFCYSSTLNMIVLAFTGTYTNVLFLTDLNYKHQSSSTIGCYGMKIHGGFLNLYSSVQDKLLELLNKYMKEDTQLIITGYSLGGAISTLATLDLYKKYNNLVHYSFASPRLFNTLGALYFDSLKISSYRIQNNSDIITSLPFPVMITDTLLMQDFMHVNTSIYFDINLNNYYDNHVITYLQYFNV